MIGRLFDAIDEKTEAVDKWVGRSSSRSFFVIVTSIAFCIVTGLCFLGTILAVLIAICNAL